MKLALVKSNNSVWKVISASKPNLAGFYNINASIILMQTS